MSRVYFYKMKALYNEWIYRSNSRGDKAEGFSPLKYNQREGWNPSLRQVHFKNLQPSQ